MPVKYSIEFCVRVSVSSWEQVFVVGNVSELGNWEPINALSLMKRPGYDDLWIGHADIAGDQELHFRYFVAQFLDSFKDSNTSKEIVVTRWETIRRPRSLIPSIECTDSPARVRNIDEFGKYDGREREDDGWLINQTEIRLRMHGEAIKFWKQRHQQRVYRIHCTPVDLRYREIFDYGDSAHSGAKLPPTGWRQLSLFVGSIDQDNDDEDSRDGISVPTLPSHTPTQIARLVCEDPNFQDQAKYGAVFQNRRDYFVFKTQSVATEFLAFLFDFYLDPGDQRPGTANSDYGSSGSGEEKPDRVGFCYLLPSNMKDTFGNKIIPITSMKHQPIGQLSVDYLIVNALSSELYRPSMALSYSRHWKKRIPLNVGHRGMGGSYTKMSAVRENTVGSLQYAAQHGADFVEFDVQLSKDRVAIVYHDFHICVSVTRRQGSTLDLPSLLAQDDLHELAVKDLRLRQLRLLKLRHHVHMSDSNPALPAESKSSLDATVSEAVRSPRKKWDVTEDTEEIQEHLPFPMLKQVLLQVDKHVGYNIEVKYPMLQSDGKWECDHYWERNEYLDRILEDVMNYAGERRIVFSSFDPDICTMLKLKQNKYPILLLCLGSATTRYVPLLDERSNNLSLSIAFAASNKLLGLNFHAEDLLRDATPFSQCSKLRLVSFVWGDDLDNKDNIRFFKELGLDGLVYDRVNESEENVRRHNIFMVEKATKDALFRSRSRSPSRANSPPRDEDLDMTQSETLRSHSVDESPEKIDEAPMFRLGN